MSTYPSKFGKYLLLERVNVGGMAEVFKAKTFGPAGFERILAVKRILPSLVEDEAFIRMFIDEARIAVQLNHSNIIQIYELGKHGEHYYIAMEYLPSRDMRAILDRMRVQGQLMSIPQAAYVISKLCEGLDYAHRRRDPAGNPMNIIHRDVSPQNILIGYEGDIKIIDFGIAKAANRDVKTQHGVLKGKFGYMSPEQVRGLPIDRRSDIFAVGVLLYEMLTGERLFICDSDYATLEKVRNAEVPPPTNYNKKVSPELEQIVLRALARDVEDRYQWASDLAEDLQRFLIEGRSLYTAKRLADFMSETYAEDIAAERRKMEDFLRSANGKEVSEEALPAPEFEEDKTFVIEASAAADNLFTQDQLHSTGIDDFSDEDDDEAKTEISPQMDFDEKTAALDPDALRDLASAETALPPPVMGSRTFESETEPHRPGKKGLPSIPSVTSPTLPTDPVRAAMREELGPTEATATAYRPAATPHTPGAPGGVRPAAHPGSTPGSPVPGPRPAAEVTPRPQPVPGQAAPPAGMQPPPPLDARPPGGAKKALPKGCMVALVAGMVMSAVMVVGAAGALYWYLNNGKSNAAHIVLSTSGEAAPANVQVYLDDAVVAAQLPADVEVTTAGAHTVKVTADGMQAWESEVPVALDSQVKLQVEFVAEGGGEGAQVASAEDVATKPSEEGGAEAEAVAEEAAADETPPDGTGKIAAKAAAPEPVSGEAAEKADQLAASDEGAGQAAKAGPKLAMLAPGEGWRVSFTAIHRDERKTVTDAVVYLDGHELGRLPFEADIKTDTAQARFVVRAPGFTDAELNFARPAEGGVGPITVLMAPGESGTVDIKGPQRVAMASDGATPEKAEAAEDAPATEASGDEAVAPTQEEPEPNDEAVEEAEPAPAEKKADAPKPAPQRTAKAASAKESRKPARKGHKARAGKRKSTKTAKKAHSGTARISVGARPAASVYIDRKFRGSTPLMLRKAPELSLGAHYMMLKEKRTGKTVKFKIELRKKGGTNKLIYDFEKGEIVHREGAMKVTKR